MRCAQSCFPSTAWRLSRAMGPCACAALLIALSATPHAVHAGYLIDPAGGTTLWNSGTNVDDEVVSRPLGLTMDFFGTPITNVYVSTNGNLNLDGFNWYSNSTLSSAPAMIAPLWDDHYIYQGTTQKITEKAVAGQYYSVTWDVSQFSNNLPRFQFQAVLFGGTTTINGTTYLPDDIVFAYNRVDADFRGGNATIGLSGGDGTFATLPAFEPAAGSAGNAQAGFLPTAPGALLLARPDGSGGYGGSFVTAVPEPAGWCIAIAGVASGGMLFRRRRGAAARTSS